ncbi:hypothetical protein [Anaeromyxobacter oryzisoli]|uniref:hypothetical protein n=1 Tax=Anaeromyxobacter oryzisoli TaxID=2925408 RepID=UPI001F59486E|nr:hypothetical protein [Anaeromyxobacter sp. SG63]
MTTAGAARRAAGWAAPERAVAALVAPLLAAGALAAVGWVPWAELLAARTVTIFAGLAALAAAAAGGRASASGRRGLAAAWVAGALALAAGAAALATRIEGEVDAGLDEDGPSWRIAHAGLAAVAPALKVLEVPATRPSGKIRLLVDGREVVAEAGEPVAVGRGRRLVVRDVLIAPALSVERARGEVEGSALVKLDPGRREWFTAGTLPHRFYVTVPEPAGTALAAPRSLHVRVQRGKLRVHEGDLAAGSEARFEGITLRLEKEGAPWARIELRSAPDARAIAFAVLAVAAAFVVARRARGLRGADA